MNLLASLNAGFAACPNGWVELYIRGSSTRATWYSSFEGDGANSTGNNITLDAYGSAEVYVNQLVDVVVKQSDGTLYRQYTDGYSSPNTEVISQSFTGTDYVTAASGASKPTTLQSVLDLWYTNAGAIDWEVNIGGSATTLLNAFGFGTGLVYNVKSPAYGAVGDGVTNDQTAIQAALAAAVAAGGGIVFFPKGTYLIATAIEWDQRVSMMGVGSGVSLITTNSASNDKVLKFTTGSSPGVPFVVSGMAFGSTQSNTGSQVYATVGLVAIFQNCYFGASSTSTGIGVEITGTPGRVIFRDCLFDLNGNNPGTTWGAVNRVVMDSCWLRTTQTAYNGSFIKAGSSESIFGCLFDSSSVTTLSTIYYIEETLGVGGLLSVTGNRFADGSGMNSSAASAHIRPKSSAAVFATGNVGGQYFRVSINGGTPLAGDSRIQMRSDLAGTLAVPSCVDETYYSGAAPTFTMPTGMYEGQQLRFLLRPSGGGWTPIFTGATVMPGVTIPAMTNGNGGVVDCVYTNVSGAYAWRIVYAVGA